MIDTGMDSKSINYENDSVSYAFDKLIGIDVKKSFDEYVKKMPILPTGTK